ncbi:MAG: hypothetical protein IIY02_02410 [Firmicutes bacterium]|nr:hypothetical protein [Bacillota bacterium]
MARTLKGFLQKALMPLGSTMYIYGGGWNEATTAPGMNAAVSVSTRVGGGFLNGRTHSTTIGSIAIGSEQGWIAPVMWGGRSTIRWNGKPEKKVMWKKRGIWQRGLRLAVGGFLRKKTLCEIVLSGIL